MAAYENLSWLPSSDDFLKAIIAGGEVGVKRQELIQRAFQHGQQSSSGGVGAGFGGAIRSNALNPLDQARLDSINNEEKRKGDFEARKSQQLELADNYMRHGDTPIQAYNRANLGQFGLPPPVVEKLPATPWDTLNLGQGEVARVNSQTGQIENLKGARPVAEKEATLSVPVFPAGYDPTTDYFHTVRPTIYRGTASAVDKALGRNTPTPQGQPLPLPPRGSGKEAFQIGLPYETAYGPAIWNGDGFDPITPTAQEPSASMGNAMSNAGELGVSIFGGQ